jgi:hypothetical protein
MRYTYDGYLAADTGPGGSLQRSFTTTSFEEAEKEYFNVDLIKVTDNMSKQEVFRIRDEDDLAAWRTTLECKAAWNPVKDLLTDHVKKDPGDIPLNPAEEAIPPDEPIDYNRITLKEAEESIAVAVTPPHYQNYINDYQWIDAMSRLPSFRDPNVFAGALELQVRKYLDRLGQKDQTYQELGKALFYLEYWRQYVGWAYFDKDRPTAESVQAKLK